MIYAFGIDSNLVAGNRNNLVESFVSKSERIGYIATMNVAWDFFILRILYLFIQKAREVNRLGFADDGFLVFYQLIDDGRANTRINQGQLEIFDCKRQLFLLIEDFSDDFISSCLWDSVIIQQYIFILDLIIVDAQPRIRYTCNFAVYSVLKDKVGFCAVTKSCSRSLKCFHVEMREGRWKLTKIERFRRECRWL